MIIVILLNPCLVIASYKINLLKNLALHSGHNIVAMTTTATITAIATTSNSLSSNLGRFAMGSVLDRD